MEIFQKPWPKAVARRCSIKKVFLEISQNSQENTCSRDSFWIKSQASGLRTWRSSCMINENNMKIKLQLKVKFHHDKPCWSFTTVWENRAQTFIPRKRVENNLQWIKSGCKYLCYHYLCTWIARFFFYFFLTLHKFNYRKHLLKQKSCVVKILLWPTVKKVLSFFEKCKQPGNDENVGFMC